MKVYYDSWLARVLTFVPGFGTMMLFGVVITDRAYLLEKTRRHEEVHVRQFWDCFAVGLALSLTVMVWALTAGCAGWWTVWLAVVPWVLYYAVYGGEWLWWLVYGLFRKGSAYERVSFERQARWVAETYNWSVERRREYRSFGWWRKEVRRWNG